MSKIDEMQERIKELEEELTDAESERNRAEDEVRQLTQRLYDDVAPVREFYKAARAYLAVHDELRFRAGRPYGNRDAELLDDGDEYRRQMRAAVEKLKPTMEVHNAR